MGTLTGCTFSTLDFNFTLKTRQIPGLPSPKKPRRKSSSCFLCSRASVNTQRICWVPRRNFGRLRCYSSSDNGDGDGESSSSSSGSSSNKSTDSTTMTTTEVDEDKTRTNDYDSEPPSVSSRPPTISPLGPAYNNFQVDSFKLMELLGPEKVDPADVKLIKEALFGYSTFWVTKEEPFGDLGEGVLFLGNLRGKREEVFAKFQRLLAEVTGNKYNLFMVEEPNAEDLDPRGGPRVSFGLLRKEVSEPGPTTLWQYVIAFLLFLLTIGSSVELGIASQINKLPPEVVKYFTDPNAVDPPDMELLSPFVDSALPLAYGVLGVLLFHFKSILPDRSTKVDISLAGPFAGAALSLSMFAVGLLLSSNPNATGELVQVPSTLFQGSLLLGLISRATLGYASMHAATVPIHPLMIAGWCGLTTTAFNMLPVGCLDGGRAVQGAFGKNALVAFGLTTYTMLGLGVLGGPLSLPWGLYVLICQRTPEKPCLNDVTEVGTWRKTIVTAAVFLVVLTLLPVWDELAEELGIGLVSTF
ncbi:probable zinc metalloprotease EGY1, chloroplastic isoform X2 [Pyrus x bretschneideri]|uniref:probable zinc metalloprotease EGY1, chloroplastic isoform X2 n=1 Tax=Pyrus x bretschneideri TaxID=225117 RepID=UPI00202F2A17|nr:probable zinc metalloprotease EGY1, chloroplastic isoform X2 [Pyrus x bretschneideri]